MQSETKNCQNCKHDFVIEPDDFAFYEKIQVPPPTFCPTCRFQKRIMFRNERVLYKRNCDKCNKSMVSIFRPDNGYTVYCSKCWWSDDWDMDDYYLDYDPKRNFFEQFDELLHKTPMMDLIVDYSTLVNSEYVNHAGSLKNCYLIFNADLDEDCYYSATIVSCKEVMDSQMINNSELCYECIGGDGSRMFFSENCPESVNVWYSKDCVGCTDCFGCVNLRNKSHCFFNEQLSKEDFKNKIQELELDKYSSHQKIQKSIIDFWNKFPRKDFYGRMNVGSTGDYVYACKNAKDCYQVVQAEDCRYCQFITMPKFTDAYDISEWGHGLDMCIDSITIGEGAYMDKYVAMVWNNVRGIEYSMYVVNSSDCFGCANLRNKKYRILNKQYTKEEYEKLKEEIIQDMKDNPYIDSKGRAFGYGDFFPYDVSPFTYNESYAVQYFDLSKSEILENGFKYSEKDLVSVSDYCNTKDIPDSINDIDESYQNKIIMCECGNPYRIVPGELNILKKMNLPLPRKCIECRHKRRMSRMNNPYIYDRECMSCKKDTKTSYAPDRPEIVYCESCYQKEVI